MVSEKKTQRKTRPRIKEILIMPLTGKELEKAQRRLIRWEYYVDAMDAIDLPKDHVAYREMSKYGRFTGFLKEYLGSLLTSKKEKSVFAKLNLDKDNVPENWWSVAMKVGNGKGVENTIPQIKQPVSEEDRKKVLDTLLPAYRALSESFEKRWSIEWIFNHDQYTAERDSLRAIRGVMMSLLNCSRNELDSALAKYVEDVPTTGRTAEERQEDSSDYREPRRIDMKYERYCEKIADKKGITVEEVKQQLKEEGERANRYYERWQLKQQGMSDEAVEAIMEAKFGKTNEEVDDEMEKESAGVELDDVQDKPIFDPNSSRLDDTMEISPEELEKFMIK